MPSHIRHDYANVQRIIDSLDKWLAEDDWVSQPADDDALHSKWLKAQTILSVSQRVH